MTPHPSSLSPSYTAQPGHMCRLHHGQQHKSLGKKEASTQLLTRTAQAVHAATTRSVLLVRALHRQCMQRPGACAGPGSKPSTVQPLVGSHHACTSGCSELPSQAAGCVGVECAGRDATSHRRELHFSVTPRASEESTHAHHRDEKCACVCVCWSCHSCQSCRS